MSQTVSDVSGSLWLNSSAVYDRDTVTSASVRDKHHSHSHGAVEGAILSLEDFNTASTVIECGIMPALSVLGLPANIINMVVFYRQGLRDKMNLCLFTLAFTDFMFLLSIFISTFYCPAAFLSYALTAQVLKWNTRKFTLNFLYGFLYSSGILTAVIATERCICVVWPLKSATIFKTRTMAVMIFGIIVVLNFLCLLYALKHVVKIEIDEGGNTVVLYEDTELYLAHKFAFQVIRDGILPSINFITFFVLSFVTVVTVRKLKTAMDWRQKTSSNVMDTRQMTLVKILITVSCVYITCSIPKISLAIVRFLLDDFSSDGKYSNLFFVTHRSGLALLMVNSSVNIFIYYRQSSRFRKELYACRTCWLLQRSG